MYHYADMANLVKNKTPVHLYLTNGVKLQGFVRSIEQDGPLCYVILVHPNGKGEQAVFLHAISTIMPAAVANVTVAPPRPKSSSANNPEDQTSFA